MQIIPRKYLKDAPCYWELTDDGANFTCKDCKIASNAKEMYIVLTPNGIISTLHRNCIDGSWLQKAKKMQGKV